MPILESIREMFRDMEEMTNCVSIPIAVMNTEMESLKYYTDENP